MMLKLLCGSAGLMLALCGSAGAAFDPFKEIEPATTQGLPVDTSNIELQAMPTEGDNASGLKIVRGTAVEVRCIPSQGTETFTAAPFSSATNYIGDDAPPISSMNMMDR